MPGAVCFGKGYTQVFYGIYGYKHVIDSSTQAIFYYALYLMRLSIYPITTGGE
jgi:hypothetical protein